MSALTISLQSFRILRSLKGSLTKVMPSSNVFFLFWSAHVFYMLSTQGSNVDKLKSVHVYNGTDEAALQLMFKQYVQTQNRTYIDDPEEYNRRLLVFKVVPCLIVF